jgi:hypothetical protein
MRILITLSILFNIGCTGGNYINKDCPVLSHVKYEDHACPEEGHGVCYVCFDPNKSKKNIILVDK